MELKPLNKAEFEIYVEKAVKNYENELSVSGVATKEHAQQQAKDAFNRLLPQGFNTKDNYFYHAYDENNLVGFIWYSIRGDNAYIYDFYIEESMRRKGYGKKVILACEKKAQDNGATKISLHVFGHNKAARALYESLNYVPISIQMRKELK